MNLFFSLIFFFYLKKEIHSIIQFNFEKFNTNVANINSLKYHSSNYPDTLNNLSKNDFMFRLLTDDLYLNLKIGSPPQIIPTIWKMDYYSFKIYNLSYNYSRSTTYQGISENFIYSFDEVSEALFCKDLFYFLDEYNNSIIRPFKYINIKNDKKNYSFIGLQLPDATTDNLITFIKQLKENDIINKYIFYIIYDRTESRIDNPNGIIYFGDYPHNIKKFSDKYNINNYFEIKVANRNKLAYWDILFDNIYFCEKNKNNNDSIKIKHKQVELLGNMQISIGTDEYHEFISSYFFEEYVKHNICEQKTILNETDYIYYKCQKNNNFNITKFPSLFFELKEVNFNFTLDYNDLFFIHDDYIYFGIIFDKYFKLKFNQRWKLGSALFKKYLLVFNQDSKTIGFYNNIINKNIFEPFNNNIKKDNNYDFDIIKVFPIFFLSIIIILCFRFIIRKFQNKRKGNSELINYNKAKVGYSFKNKNEIHNYYELKNN